MLPHAHRFNWRLALVLLGDAAVWVWALARVCA